MSAIPSAAVARLQNNMIKTFSDNIPFSSSFSFDGVHQRQDSHYSNLNNLTSKQSISDMTRRDTVSAMRTHIAISDNTKRSSIASKEV